MHFLDEVAQLLGRSLSAEERTALFALEERVRAAERSDMMAIVARGIHSSHFARLEGRVRRSAFAFHVARRAQYHDTVPPSLDGVGWMEQR